MLQQQSHSLNLLTLYMMIKQQEQISETHAHFLIQLCQLPLRLKNLLSQAPKDMMEYTDLL